MYTYENIMDLVVNNRMMSRKDKQKAIRDFLKNKTGVNKPTNEAELALLDKLKTIRQSYMEKDAAEKSTEKASS
ncbi:MAG: hypothetical protein MUF42_14555 [Cytophagaceae bacterium]|jgi:hypothetical protein|nr:hypothetical protein [Cytophagaceae bacterium]